MKSKLIGISTFFIVLVILATACVVAFDAQQTSDERTSEGAVLANEVNHLIADGDYENAELKSRELRDKLSGSDDEGSDVAVSLIIIGGIAIAFIVLVFLYIYIAVIRPFEKMKAYAERIASGNLDIPLDYTRSNYFGEFTWAFDSMRREIIRARACEREAVDNNKTVIATLSHDIKTPVASIRAYAEGLEANLDKTPERRAKYLGVIMNKCDEVSRLTNDLFLHSLSDLDKLKLSPEPIELCGFLSDVVSELAAGNNDVEYSKPEFEAVVSADKNRLLQVIENLINNSRKYAKTKIEVSVARNNGSVEIRFRDYGNGIPDEDMPFIFGKFYRGKNVGNEQGSGLGLYIVKYIIEKQDGSVQLINHADGLEAIVLLPEKTF